VCVSPAASKFLDPGGFIAQKANTAVMVGPLEQFKPLVNAGSGLQGTVAAYKDYQKAPDQAQPEQPKGPTSTTPFRNPAISIPTQPVSNNGLNIPV
jgi:hypothetical protein